MTAASGPLLPSWSRSRRMVQRNVLVYKHSWTVIFTGFFEPVFYLFGIGLGMGALVSSVDGLSYVSFVAPGLPPHRASMAHSAMVASTSGSSSIS